ncbi:hypothetical protein MHU86_13263 [Fragilaria crotonensis]|nr:hypothetical protein MHU86_13263 [Fragilaria crotonensis]
MTFKPLMQHPKNDTRAIRPTIVQSKHDIEALLQIKKQLRRLKRRLFLEASKKPETSVDKFRQLVMHLTFDESSTAGMSTFNESFESFPSMQSTHEGTVSISPDGLRRFDCLAQSTGGE